MPSKKTRQLRANVDVLAFTSLTNELEWMRCQTCEGALRLIQPDELSPYRLMGVCEECRGLYLILMKEDLQDAIMVLLHPSEWHETILEARDNDQVSCPTDDNASREE